MRVESARSEPPPPRPAAARQGVPDDSGARAGQAGAGWLGPAPDGPGRVGPAQAGHACGGLLWGAQMPWMIYWTESETRCRPSFTCRPAPPRPAPPRPVSREASAPGELRGGGARRTGGRVAGADGQRADGRGRTGGRRGRGTVLEVGPRGRNDPGAGWTRARELCWTTQRLLSYAVQDKGS